LLFLRVGGHCGFGVYATASSSAAEISSLGKKAAGAPAIRQENIKNDVAVRSIAGSTVLYDC
jgi:hypothetical protein